MLLTKQISFIFLTKEALFRSAFFSKEIRYILFYLIALLDRLKPENVQGVPVFHHKKHKELSFLYPFNYDYLDTIG